MSIVRVPLVDIMGLEPILSIKGIVITDTIINFDGDFHGHVDVTCKQTLKWHCTDIGKEWVSNPFSFTNYPC